MDSHFEHVHPEYAKWRRPFMQKLLLGMSLPFIAIAAEGLNWGFRTSIGSSSLAFAILLSSFVPLLPLTIRYSLVNRKFRQEWVAAHGDGPSRTERA